MGDRVVIAGASGFIGRFLAQAFTHDGATVSVIGRTGADARWGDAASLAKVLDGADMLINLSGKSVNCRYTARNRAEILRSRIDTTRELAQALRECSRPPALWVNASTATIYRHADDHAMTEAAGEIGEGFSVDVATAWEHEFFNGELPNTRRVALRMAIVLGGGGALVPMIRLVRFGLGGAQLDGRWFSTRSRRNHGTFHRFRSRGGRQKFSWIHIDDVVGIIRFVRDRSDMSGVINVVAPGVSDNRTLMSILRLVIGVPLGLPAPRWVLEVGTFIIRTETELVLKSRLVTPERLINSGYTFFYPNLEPAMRQIVADRRRH